MNNSATAAIPAVVSGTSAGFAALDMSEQLGFILGPIAGGSTGLGSGFGTLLLITCCVIACLSMAMARTTIVSSSTTESEEGGGDQKIVSSSTESEEGGGDLRSDY